MAFLIQSNLLQLNPLERCLYLLVLHQGLTLDTPNITLGESEWLQIASLHELLGLTGTT